MPRLLAVAAVGLSLVALAGEPRPRKAIIYGGGLTAAEADLHLSQVARNTTGPLAEEFFRAVSNSARLTLHVTVETGTNAHHMIEAAFKAFARALRSAIAIDPTETGVPSTKGTLTS